MYASNPEVKKTLDEELKEYCKEPALELCTYPLCPCSVPTELAARIKVVSMPAVTHMETEDSEPTEAGDAYDYDSGDYLGTLNLQPVPGSDTPMLPAAIEIFYNGSWYIFKPDSRYKDEEVEKEKVIPASQVAPEKAT